jgi:hypothetical protein
MRLDLFTYIIDKKWRDRKKDITDVERGGEFVGTEYNIGEVNDEPLRLYLKQTGGDKWEMNIGWGTPDAWIKRICRVLMSTDEVAKLARTISEKDPFLG